MINHDKPLWDGDGEKSEDAFDHEMMGIIMEAREKGQIGHLPLADLEVKPKTDKNYWPVREYVVWFANR